VEPGTPVRVVNEPVKFGRIGGELFIEVNPDEEQSFQLDETGKLPTQRAPEDLREKVKRAAGKDADRLDWPRIERAALRRSGVPTPATLSSPAVVSRSGPPPAPAGSRP
jgi:L,D-transpeptidase ErfK/SrfK